MIKKLDKLFFGDEQYEIYSKSLNSTGNNTEYPMTQKATTDAINTAIDESKIILNVTGSTLNISNL